MPKTNYGKWALGSIVAMFLLFSIRPIISKYIFNSVPSEGFISRYIMENLTRGAFAAGMSALVNGLISIFDKKDRGVWIVVSTIIGAIATVIFIVLFFFPH